MFEAVGEPDGEVKSGLWVGPPSPPLMSCTVGVMVRVTLRSVLLPLAVADSFTNLWFGGHRTWGPVSDTECPLPQSWVCVPLELFVVPLFDARLGMAIPTAATTAIPRVRRLRARTTAPPP